jgi:hypothetical protein
MSFFNKIFGFDSESKNNSLVKHDSPEVWSAKFFLMAITETTEEPPSIDDVKDILSNSFPNFPQNELDSVYFSIVAMQNKTSNLTSEWDNIWKIFFSQLEFFKLSDSFTVMRELASTCWKLKMLEDMDEIAENFTYRISQSEEYFKISKSDIKEIFEEEKANSGYNDSNRNY